MYLLGVKIDNLSKNETLQRIENFLMDGHQHYIVTPNPEFIVLAQKDKEFKKILNEADLSIPDGIGIVLASKILKGDIKERLSGTDLMEAIIKDKKQILKNKKIFLLGGYWGAAEKIAQKFSNVVGFTEDIERALDLINQCQPNILFVALGAPKQEKWIYYNLAKIPSVKVAIGIGGAFDFLSGRIKRAPKLLRKVGLEWLWRLVIQPWRAKRIYNAVIKFPYLILVSRFKN